MYPCLGEVKILASIGKERTSLTPNVQTMQEINPDLSVALWNGLFVHKDVPEDARIKISEAAQAALKSPQALELIGQVDHRCLVTIPVTGILHKRHEIIAAGPSLSRATDKDLQRWYQRRRREIKIDRRQC